MTDYLPGILIVDDSKVARVAAKRLLQGHFNLHFAGNGSEAIDIIEKEPQLHIVFTELNMADTDGYQLIKLIRGHGKEFVRHMPVIVISSGEKNEEARKLAFELGATDFITKPFDTVDIIARSKAYSHLHIKTLDLEYRATSLEDLVTIDPVTRLMLPEFFQQKVIQDRSFTLRHKHALSLLYIVIDELDEFRTVLPVEGLHDLFRFVSQLVNQKIRKEDTLAFFGDGEFAVSLPTANYLGARILAERIRQHIAESPFQFGGTNYEISASIGIYVPDPSQELSIDTIIEQMQAAAAVAQIGGGNQVFLDPDVPDPSNLDAPEEVPEGTPSIDQILEQIESGEITRDSVDERLLLQQVIPVFKVVSEKERLAFIERLLMISDSPL